MSMQAKLDEYCEEDEQVRKRLANILLILDTGDRSADLIAKYLRMRLLAAGVMA